MLLHKNFKKHTSIHLFNKNYINSANALTNKTKLMAVSYFWKENSGRDIIKLMSQCAVCTGVGHVQGSMKFYAWTQQSLQNLKMQYTGLHKLVGCNYHFHLQMKSLNAKTDT